MKTRQKKTMRLKLRLCAWLPALLVAGTAHAQSSITLYGLIDEGLNFTSNAGGHNAYQLKSGDTYGSRWGLKGSEDLGGGYHAIFLLENGFDNNSGTLGQGQRMFGRQATWVCHRTSTARSRWDVSTTRASMRSVSAR